MRPNLPVDGGVLSRTVIQHQLADHEEHLKIPAGFVRKKLSKHGLLSSHKEVCI